MKLTEFQMIAAQTPYVKNGMFYSEVFLFLQECSRRLVDLVIESGVNFGMSTRMLAAAFNGDVVSIDRRFIIEPPERVRFVEGEAVEVLPELLQEYHDRRVGILLDGPKGRTALALKDACFTYDCVRVVAIHDSSQGSGEHVHSHDAHFRRACGEQLDRAVLPEYAAKYPKGPGLGVWVAR